jgi:16S rRNA (guanine1207-N2)-methyltransferase
MMTDAPTVWILQQIQQHSTASSIWLSDENVLRYLAATNSPPHKLMLITNRWDIAKQAKNIGLNTQFSDFDLSMIKDNSIDKVFYRVSKEKAVVHHLINEAQRILQPGGTLWVSGHKNEGIKTYIEKASALFGCEKNIQKNGISYSSLLTKNPVAGSPLHDENYPHLRECLRLGDKNLLSKPGQFGWNKIDEGSAFLISSIVQVLVQQQFKHCLDLGCGYGYLSLASLPLAIQKRTLTDNNAAALATAKANCSCLEIEAHIIASDAGEELEKQFDLILCNPPFHQGFSVDEDLTDKFLRNAARLLVPEGVAYFVVNQFIALEKKAQPYFKSINLIARNKSFKVFELRKN